MKWTLWLFGTVLLVAGCESAGPHIEFLSGSYVGYSHRNGMDTSQVSLNFEENLFDASTNQKHNPMLCKGTFKQTETTITFSDSCLTVSSVSRAHVMQGVYNYTFNYDGTVRIWRSSEGEEVEYILKKPVWHASVL